jgi:hypothetical protein
VTGVWRKLHIKKLRNVYPTVIKPRRWAGHIARMGEIHTKFHSWKPKVRENLGDQVVDGE